VDLNRAIEDEGWELQCNEHCGLSLS